MPEHDLPSEGPASSPAPDGPAHQRPTEGGEPLDWDDFRYCLAVAETGGLRAAADRLGASHTTVGRRIAALEARLGTRLFDRLPSGLRPTEAGERAADTARRLSDEVGALQRGVTGDEARLSGRIRVTMPDILAGPVLMPAMAEFCARWPDIELELMPSYAVYDLTRREADVALRFMTIGASPEESLVGRRLAKVAYANYATPAWIAEHRTDGSDPGACWIGWSKAGPFPDWVRRGEFPRMPARGVIESAELQLAASVAGMGVAQLPCCMADLRPELVRIGASPPEALYDVWMLVHPDLRSTARLRVFRNFIARELVARRDLLEGRVSP